jgi:hypothetical protein
MKSAVILGAWGGAAYSLFAVYAMVSTISYSTWSYVQSAVYVLFLAALLRLAVRLKQHKQSLSRVITSVAMASLVFAGLYFLTFWLSTAFFADWLYQLPEFAKDYAHHGYKSPKEYLFTGNNYAELMRLEIFSFAMAMIFQVVLATAVAWAWQLVGDRFDAVHEELR